MAREFWFPERPVYSNPVTRQVWPWGRPRVMWCGNPGEPPCHWVCQKVLGSPSIAAVAGPLGGVSPVRSSESASVRVREPAGSGFSRTTRPPVTFTATSTCRSPWAKRRVCGPFTSEAGALTHWPVRAPVASIRNCPRRVSPTVMST